MSCVCLWSPDWSTVGASWDAEWAALLLEVAPRVAVERRGVVWADARGLPAVRVAQALLERLRACGIEGARAGVAALPVAAELAAKTVGEGVGGEAVRSAVDAGGAAASAGEAVWVVEPGREREFLAPLPLEWLDPAPRLAALFAGVGLVSLGDLAALSREAVEVRFGPEAVGFWRLARADDRRRLFAPIPPERPHASLDFVDYVVTDPERLVFTVNALLGNLTEALRSRGEHARRLVLTLSLANGRDWRRVLRPARPTASREAWLRLVRAVLERAELPDAVAGVALEVEAAEAAAVQQGDLFDRGFATASAVEAALARLIEAQGPVVVEPEMSGHPLPERRIAWVPADPFDGAASSGNGVDVGGGASRRGRRRAGAAAVPAGGRGSAPAEEGDEDSAPGVAARLTLQLLPEPRPVEVEVARRRDHVVPVRYHDGAGWRRLVTAAGPDRVSGGQWEQAYAREYFRCVTSEGVLVWLFRDARRGTWHLHGWWD